MLSATRVIGHKEYAAGRKSDPTYDMNWRRARVAAFKPRTGGATPTEEEDDMRYVFIKQKGPKPWFAWDGEKRHLVSSSMKSLLVTSGFAKDTVKELTDAQFEQIARGEDL